MAPALGVCGSRAAHPHWGREGKNNGASQLQFLLAALSLWTWPKNQLSYLLISNTKLWKYRRSGLESAKTDCSGLPTSVP